jgi:hypothetical protein
MIVLTTMEKASVLPKARVRTDMHRLTAGHLRCCADGYLHRYSVQRNVPPRTDLT